MGCVVALRGICAPQAITTRYTDVEHHFSFLPPTGWKRNADVPAPAVDFVGPKSGKFATNIAVNVYAGPAEKADEEKRVQAIQIQYGTIYAMRAAKLGGLPAHSWRTRLKGPGFPAVENHQVLCWHGGHAVELTLTAQPAAIKKFDPVFDRLLASFEWEDARLKITHKSDPKKAAGH